MMSSFYNKYILKRKELRSVLCIGLDPDLNKIPSDTPGHTNIQKLDYFLNTIIAATTDYAIAWKPNLAFFECLGAEGWQLLSDTIQKIRQLSPDSLIILDAKRGDIGNTASYYAQAMFDDLGGDAVTLSPYMGMDTLDPFLEYTNKAIIVLCNTSNPGSGWLQDHGDPPLYIHLAASLNSHARASQIWLVVGATRSSKNISHIRSVAPNLPFLIPGIGAQGGDLTSVLKAAGNNVLINAGRSILYQADSIQDSAASAHQAANQLVASMQACLPEL